MWVVRCEGVKDFTVHDGTGFGSKKFRSGRKALKCAAKRNRRQARDIEFVKAWNRKVQNS